MVQLGIRNRCERGASARRLQIDYRGSRRVEPDAVDASGSIAWRSPPALRLLSGARKYDDDGFWTNVQRQWMDELPTDAQLILQILMGTTYVSRGGGAELPGDEAMMSLLGGPGPALRHPKRVEAGARRFLVVGASKQSGHLCLEHHGSRSACLGSEGAWG